MDKKVFELPKMTVSMFDKEDIVTSSSNKLNDFDGAKSTGKVDIITFVG